MKVVGICKARNEEHILKKTLDKQGGELIFCHAQPQILKLFETVKFLPSESVFKSLDEADQYFYAVMNKEIARQRKT